MSIREKLTRPRNVGAEYDREAWRDELRRQTMITRAIIIISQIVVGVVTVLLLR